MYCSGEYDSPEQPYDANLFEYDSYYDDCDYLTEALLVSPERSRSETWGACRKVPAPAVMQLLSQAKAEETGCSTVQQWLEKERVQAEEKTKVEAEKATVEMKAVDVARKAAKAAEKATWEAIMASLPTESKLGKQKRLAKERDERQLKSKLCWLAHKKKEKPKVKKPLPFSHRRNGGGKKRTKMVQHGTKEADRLKAVVRKRRATRRKLVQTQKKEAEEKRAKEFDMFGSEKNDKTIIIDYIKEAEVDKELEKEAEQKQAEMVRKIAIRKAVEEEAIEEKKRAAADAKARAEFAEKEAALVDERENGSWSIVESKKKVERKTSSSKKEILVIEFVTPKMVEEKKVQDGRASLVDKERMQSRLTKTRMCNSVGSGKPCRHMSRCRYAHSTDELRVGECFFKDACRHVRKTATGYSNCRHRRCSFLHPGESMQSYCGRLGLKYTQKPVVKPVPLVIPMPRLSPRLSTRLSTPLTTTNVWAKRAAQRETPKVVKPKVVKPKVKEQEWTKVKRRRSKSKSERKSERKTTSSKSRKPRPSSKCKDVICSSVGTGKPCRHGKSCRFHHVQEVHSHGQVVLRVPHSLAVQAMQHAVASGIKNFRVVVV